MERLLAEPRYGHWLYLGAREPDRAVPPIAYSVHRFWTVGIDLGGYAKMALPQSARRSLLVTRFGSVRFLMAACLLGAVGCAEAPREASALQPEAAEAPAESVTWTFDNLERIGGHAVTVEGDPQVVDTPLGKAVELDGVDDALFFDVHPLAGARTFTWEAIFRPDGGAEEQRWFHLDSGPAGGDGSGDRMLFEIRAIGDQWCLDAFVQSGDAGKALLDRSRLQPLGRWYHVAAVYDGRELRSYVNGKLDGAAPLAFSPQGPGRTSVGVRINKVYYFKGAVRQARFTRAALEPAEFLPPPAE